MTKWKEFNLQKIHFSFPRILAIFLWKQFPNKTIFPPKCVFKVNGTLMDCCCGVFFWSKWSNISLGSEGKLTLNDVEDEDENARSKKFIKNTVEKARFQLIERTVVVAHNSTVFPPFCCFFTIFILFFVFPLLLLPVGRKTCRRDNKTYSVIPSNPICPLNFRVSHKNCH